MQHLRRFLAPCGHAAILLACTASIAAEPPLKLSAEQLRIAGADFTRIVAPDEASGVSLQLAGPVVVPNSALEQVLAPLPGRVESLLVNPGETVRAGQALARIHSAEFLAMQRELLGARARWQVARSRASRDAALHAEGIIARNRLEEGEAQLAEAEALLGEHRQLLRLAGLSDAAVEALRSASDMKPVLTLYARRGGSVLQQLAAAGDAVEAGTPLMRVAPLDVLWIELHATREQAARIQPGDTARVAGCAQPGKVIASSLQLESTSQTVTVRVELRQTGGCVAPSQFVEAQLAPRAQLAGLVQVPASSLVRHQDAGYVFVRTADGVVPRRVVVERRASDAAWVRGELRVGEEVASAGLAAIKGSWLGLGAAADTP